MERESCVWYTRQGPEGPFAIGMDLVVMRSKAIARNGDAYVLAVKTDYPAAELKEPLKDMEGYFSVIGLKGRINVVVEGERQAKEIANKVFEILESPVGIVKYEDDHHSISIQVDLLKTIRIAKNKGENVHLYDPSTESLEALIEMVRGKIVKTLRPF